MARDRREIQEQFLDGHIKECGLDVDRFYRVIAAFENGRMLNNVRPVLEEPYSWHQTSRIQIHADYSGDKQFDKGDEPRDFFNRIAIDGLRFNERGIWTEKNGILIGNNYIFTYQMGSPGNYDVYGINGSPKPPQVPVRIKMPSR